VSETDEFGEILDESAGDSAEEGTKDDEGAASESKGTESSGNDERIRALQSEADKAKAAEAKARKELEALKGNAAAPDATPSGAVPPQVEEWITVASDRLRDQLYAEDSRFKDYGLPASRITGSTPAEMRASAKDLASVVDKMEANIRARVQEEHGIAPAPSAGAPEKTASFDKMSSEEFNAYVEKALRG
jgi:hypothetical protein